MHHAARQTARQKSAGNESVTLHRHNHLEIIQWEFRNLRLRPRNWSLSVYLYGAQREIRGDTSDSLFRLVHEDSNLLDAFRQILSYLPRSLRRHAPRALLIEHEPHRIGAGVY